MVGMIGELTKKQNSNREYFRDIPIGTKFMIINMLSNPRTIADNYDIRAYFLFIEPQARISNKFHFTGYVEKGTWKLLGTAKEFFLNNNV